jgi:hypothetical protein
VPVPVSVISIALHSPSISGSILQVMIPSKIIAITAPQSAISAYNAKIEIDTVNIASQALAPTIAKGIAISADLINIVFSAQDPSIACGAALLIDAAIGLYVSYELPEIVNGAAVLTPVSDISIDYGLKILHRYHELYEDIATDWTYSSYLIGDASIYGITTNYHQIVTGAAVLPPTVQIGVVTVDYIIAGEFIQYYGDYIIQNYSYDQAIYAEWWGS